MTPLQKSRTLVNRTLRVEAQMAYVARSAFVLVVVGAASLSSRRLALIGTYTGAMNTAWA